MSVTVGVDLGGTKILAAAVDDGHEVTGRHKVATPSGPDEVLEAIASSVEALDVEVRAVGIGVPGPIREGELLHAPNLVGFDAPVDVAGRLGERLGVPVMLENDANAGVFGEWVAGAGRGADHVLGVWAGTGIGGGLVLDGRPYRGAFGAAGELGHVIVRQGGALCGCGRRGCIEAYAGRGNMAARVENAVANGTATRLYEIMQDKGKGRLTSSVWAKALDKGDALATLVLDEAVDALAAGIGGVLNLLDLSRVVVGGGLAEKLGQDFADRLAAATRRYLLVPDAEREFVAAALGDDAGVIGAAAVARAAALVGTGEQAP